MKSRAGEGYRFRKSSRMKRALDVLQRIRPSSLPTSYRRNRVVLFPDGRQFFKALFASIRAAEHFVLLEYYIIRDDRTGRALADELGAALGRGVRVLLIYDYIGCLDTPSGYFRTLAQLGVDLIPFNVPSFRRGVGRFDRRDHRKMTIIDGALAFLGGCNIADEYAGLKAHPRSFRDMGFSVAGSAVQELIHIFAEVWQMERGSLPQLPQAVSDKRTTRYRGQARVIIVSGGPHHRSSYISNAFRLSIVSASEEILIATPYFVPGPRIIRSLLRAVRRGVRVSLLLPARSDVPLVRLLGRSFYGTLLKNGVTIYELEREILHAKVMLIDGERTVLGSANLDQRSFHRNLEINGIIDSRGFGGQIRRMLQENFRDARRIRLADHERRGMLARLLERVINLFSWFL